MIIRKSDVDLLAAQIAADLFTNGSGSHAELLRLKDTEGNDLGGWCERAAKDRIAEMLMGWLVRTQPVVLVRRRKNAIKKAGERS